MIVKHPKLILAATIATSICVALVLIIAVILRDGNHFEKRFSSEGKKGSSKVLI